MHMVKLGDLILGVNTVYMLFKAVSYRLYKQSMHAYIVETPI